MKYIPDKTGRFKRRPYFEEGELDRLCEKIIVDFMVRNFGSVTLPIPTNALTILIEEDADDLDLYADLSEEGEGLEGVTDFFIDQKPKVRIAKELSEQSNREHRLRTTLSHEYGHVKFHSDLLNTSATPSLFSDLSLQVSHRCNRETIISITNATDWMEWQAGYVCGALLMPLSYVKDIVHSFLTENKLYSPIFISTLKAVELRSKIANEFHVSQDAAKVRLLKLGYLSTTEVNPLPF